MAGLYDLKPERTNLYKSNMLEISKKQPLDYKLNHFFMMDLEACENKEQQKQDQFK